MKQVILIVILIFLTVPISQAKAHQKEHESSHDVTTMPVSEHHDFEWHEVVEVLGITTFTLLVLTACAGYFMPRKRKVLFKWHKRLAVMTLIAAMLHGILVLLTT